MQTEELIAFMLNPCMDNDYRLIQYLFDKHIKNVQSNIGRKIIKRLTLDVTHNQHN